MGKKQYLVKDFFDYVFITFNINKGNIDYYKVLFSRINKKVLFTNPWTSDLDYYIMEMIALKMAMYPKQPIIVIHKPKDEKLFPVYDFIKKKIQQIFDNVILTEGNLLDYIKEVTDNA